MEPPPTHSPFFDRRILFVALCLALFVTGGPDAFGDERRAAGPSPAFELPGKTCPPPEHLQREMKKFIGIPYRLGGAGPKGMDCSGFTKQVFRKLFGIQLPHNSSQQSKLPFLKEVSKAELQTGDLIFFGPKKKRINHVGIYLAEGKFIHAGRRSGITVANLNTNYWKSRFMASKRVKGLELPEEKPDRPYLEALASASAFAPDSADRSPPALALGYEKGLWDGSLHLKLEAFLELSTAADNRGTRVYHPGLRDEEPSQDPTDWEFQKGWQASATITPLGWLEVTPSLSFIEPRGDGTDLDHARQMLGLETRLALPESRLSLFMSARAANRGDLTTWPPVISADWDAVDISFGLHYHISNSLHLSLSGTPENDNDSRLNDHTPNWGLPIEDFSLRLDLDF
ncbi:MAG: C40 family peptidase [Desulfobacterales bacterium]|nr:MAG: C40 family peptidase [Desulfobacterales bacterium]